MILTSADDSTSPSVYMIVDKIYGTNPAGEIAGPSGTSVIFPLDLNEVSTIVPNISATHQLTLNDLRTDCPQTEPASVIATKIPGGPCDPILAAPKKVKSWASPCGACENFGLFDPPYAVPPLSGGLVPVTTTTTEPTPQTTTAIASATQTATTEEITASATPQSTSASETATNSEAVTLTESSGSYVGTIPVTIPSSALQSPSEATTASSTSSDASTTSETDTGDSSGVSSIPSPDSSSSSVLSSSSSAGAAPSSSTPAAFSAATKLPRSLVWMTSLVIGGCLL
ncbi:uncharacterized protein N7469_003341 [Penicillium citrinum]|uniref:Uncharacterized protein n=1 Tax=Penicillium citrinum TaxID=5077 RepID=A0A9W9TQ52_PENCI|nr:uncharacterized protein N7469_003341 [Penicillium citrinum]KAJ5234173.1 hypothetical protein N7469_003341 [Penicillium citrinum]